MRALLGPPPTLPGLQSKAPSRDQAPTAELGSWYPRLCSSLLCWGIGGARRGRPWRRVQEQPLPSGLSNALQICHQTGLGESMIFKSQRKVFCP